MPIYLFTYHAYGTWMPDRPEGYVRRGHGILPRDDEMGRRYRQAALEAEVAFDERVQLLIIDETRTACEKQGYTCRYVATETTHAHVLALWTTGREWDRVRGGLRSSITRRLNRELGRRTWLVEKGSGRGVRDDAHLAHLVETYLPSHGGWKWCPEKGTFR
ncbi:MAG: hypothetical protein WED34_19975 [Planctomycetales bacterium]